MNAAAGYRLELKDEYTHEPDGSKFFNESVYLSGFDAKTGAGGWLRIGNRVGEGYAEVSVCLHLPGGRIACQFKRSKITNNDRQMAGGLEYRVIEPFKHVQISYDGELLLLDDPNMLREPETMFKTAPRERSSVLFSCKGVSPLHGGEPISDDVEPFYPKDMARAHFNQHTAVEGSITVGDETVTINGYGWRDHSWGPRIWQSFFAHRLFMCNFGNGRALTLVKDTSRDGTSKRGGVLLIGDEYEEVTDLDVIPVEWSDKFDPLKIRLGVRTANRCELINVEMVESAPLRNRREIDGKMIITRVFEGISRYTWGDRVGFGATEFIERVEDDVPVGYPL